MAVVPLTRDIDTDPDIEDIAALAANPYETMYWKPGSRWELTPPQFVTPEMFGTVDGVADDVQIQAAIDAAFTYGIPEVRLRGIEYFIASTLTIGNGSTSQYSTKNNVNLIGVGTQFLRLSAAGSPLQDTGTRLKWTGSSGGTMMVIAGPSMGTGVQNIGFNGGGTAAKCLRTVSVNRSYFRSLTFDNYTSIAWDNDVVDKSQISGTTGETDQTTNNIAENIQAVVPANCIGIQHDGFDGSATSGEENGGDPVRWFWKNVYLLINRTGGVGWHWRFADQCQVDGYHATGTGTNDGNSCSVKFTRMTTNPGGFVFPQNIFYTGDIDHGQDLPPLVIVDGSGSGLEGGHHIGDFTTNDTQHSLTWPATKYTRGVARQQGIFPRGGWVVDQGPIAGKTHHNVLLNSRFLVQTDGASGTAIANGAHTVDQFQMSYDGVATVDWSLVEISPGYTDNDGYPRYALQISYTPSSGNSYCRLLQPVQVPGVGAELFNGCKSTYRVGLKQTAGTAIAVSKARHEQRFGTGGSPSSTITTEVSAPVEPASAALTSDWKFLDYVISVPHTGSKTRGSNQDDYINVGLEFPVSGSWTIQILLPQYALGAGASVFDQRSAAEDEYECLRFARLEGAGRAGAWANTTTLAIGIPLVPPMRATPTASLSTVTTSSTVSSPGTGTFTVNTVSMTNADKRGCIIALGGATGATAKEDGYVYSSLIKLSARL